MYSPAKGKRMRPRRPSTTEASGVDIPTLTAGLFLVVIVMPLVVAPFSASAYRDPKLVVLLVGTLMIAASGLRVDRRLAVAVGVWIGVVALASALGVDRWFSFMADEERGAGFLMLAAAGLLLLAGTAMPRTVTDRLPAWLVGVGASVALVTTLSRFVSMPFPLSAQATLAQVVFVGAFLAVAIVATTRLDWLRWPLLVLLVSLLSSGLANSTNRAGLGGLVIGLGIAYWRSRIPLRRVALIGATAAAVLVLWAAIPGGWVSTQRLDPTYVGSGLRERATAWEALARAWAERPLLGWGPSNTWGAYLSSAEPEQIRFSGTAWSESHNILFESLVTTGALGGLSLLVLALLTVSRALRAPPPVGWAAGAALALVPTHLLQPMGIVITTPLFLLAGIAARGGTSGPAVQGRHPVRLTQWWILIVLVAAIVLSLLRLAASTLERDYYKNQNPSALSASIRVEPPRLRPTFLLGQHRAGEAQRGLPGSEVEAQRLAERIVRWHPWHPMARRYAAEIHARLGNFTEVERLLRLHMERFPNDSAAIEYFAELALRQGDRVRAGELARRAVDINRSDRAREILRRATSLS